MQALRDFLLEQPEFSDRNFEFKSHQEFVTQFSQELYETLRDYDYLCKLREQLLDLIVKSPYGEQALGKSIIEVVEIALIK